MKISIQKALLDKFLDMKVGVLVVQGIDNLADYSNLQERFQMIQEDLQKKYQPEDIENIKEIANWKRVFEKVGMNSKKYTSSIENMLKRIVKDQKWIKPLSPMVDVYNTVSLEYMTPIGAYDLDRAGDNFEIRFAKKDDKFVPLGKQDFENCDDGEVVFADEKEILCRNWVWKQSDHKKVQKCTQNVLIRIEALGKNDEELKNIMDELCNLIDSTVGGEISRYILNKENLSTDLPEIDKDEFRKKAKLINEILNRGVAEINVREDLEAELWSSRKLRIKLGIDPTGFDLTLGHAVVLRKLKQFQDAGHQIVFLIGNFTAQIGDPTGKSQTRKILTKQEVMENAKTYLKQAKRVLDVSKFEIVYNADWLEGMTFAEVLKLAGNFTVAQMLERDMFQERMKANKEINLVEFMYPLMQGYDSVPLKADVEIGGTDQLFNMMAARPIQKSFEVKPQNVLTVPILVGLDGKEKMSKSLGNYIGILDSAKEMYGKTMSIPDNVILNYFELATEVPLDEIKDLEKELKAGKNPRDVKARLAFEITKLYHGENEALKAREEFDEIFKKGGLPDEIGEFKLEGREEGGANLNSRVQEILVAVGFCGSKGEAKRAIEGGGVRIDGEKISDINFELKLEKEDKKLLQLGKRKFVYLVK